MTDYQKAQLRLECAKVTLATGSKLGIEKGDCFRIAEQMFKFVMGEAKESPKANIDFSG